MFSELTRLIIGILFASVSFIANLTLSGFKNFAVKLAQEFSQEPFLIVVIDKIRGIKTRSYENSSYLLQYLFNHFRLRTVSILVYKKRQSSQAEMIKKVLKQIKTEPRSYDRLIATDIFDFEHLVKSYQTYCSGTKKGSVLEIFEKSACNKNL